MSSLSQAMLVWQPKGTDQWTTMTFDAASSEGFVGESIVTKYPVDEGFEVSDHSIKLNRTIPLEVHLSSVTLKQGIGGQKGFGAAFSEIMQVLGEDAELDSANNLGYLAGVDGAGFNDKVLAAFETLNQLNATGTRVHYIGARGVRTNCAIVQMAEGMTIETALCPTIKLVLEQMTVVKLSDYNVEKEEMAPTHQFAGKAIGPTPVKGSASGVFRLRSIPEPTVTEADDEYESLNHRVVPFSKDKSTTFEYEGVQYTISKITKNEVDGKLRADLKYRTRSQTKRVKDIALTSGADLVWAYSTPLPSLIAENLEDVGQDPTSTDNLALYIIQDYEKYFVEVS